MCTAGENGERFSASTEVPLGSTKDDTDEKPTPADDPLRDSAPDAASQGKVVQVCVNYIFTHTTMIITRIPSLGFCCCGF